MLQAPQPTPYDLQFQLWRFPVRVSWSFWLMAVVLGWDWSRGQAAKAEQLGNASLGAPAFLFVWTACVLATILIHELGHAVAMRYFGGDAQIVLYHFGGLAINDSFTRWDGGRRRRTVAWEDLVVSAAGPLAQLLLAAVMIMIAIKMSSVPFFLVQWFNLQLDLDFLEAQPVVIAMFDAIIWTSIVWALLNLIPILPLDGGQIMYNLMLMMGMDNAWLNSRYVSIAVGLIAGLLLMRTFGGMSGIMFLMLAASNWQEIQSGPYRF